MTTRIGSAPSRLPQTGVRPAATEPSAPQNPPPSIPGPQVTAAPAAGAAALPYNETQARAAVADRHLLSLRRNNDPEQVRELQRRLQAQGFYDGPIDGNFSDAVLASVTSFQSERGLQKDGVVGQQTWAALMGIEGAQDIPPGIDWLSGWASYRRTATTDEFRPQDTSAQAVDLRGELRPENASETPRWRQGDPRWGSRLLNTARFAAKGCAVTSMAMALSGATGRELRPDQLDSYLDAHGGYVGNNVSWQVAARAAGTTATRHQGTDLSTIDRNLAQNRPVVLGVDYKGDSNTDHWITITGRALTASGQRVYLANDPATGGQVRLVAGRDGRLTSNTGGMGNYRSTGMVTIGS